MERARVLKWCEPVNLVVGSTLCEPEQNLRYVYFPLTGFISLVATISGHRPLEIALIGNEGMCGVTLVLGINAAPVRGVVRAPGIALRATARELRRELLHIPSLLRTLNRYLYVSMAQLTQSAACTRFHEVEARLARWLLLSHDRAQADHFYLTHEFLGDMLGVRRSSVTIAAGALQMRALIRYARGEITILDRKGLQSASCECYDAAIDAYARLLP
jgi:CRP-like cAMP-binding protein